MRPKTLAVIAVIAIAQCTAEEPVPAARVTKTRIAAARLFTTDCGRSRLSGWNVQASATGSDCGVLLIETPMILEDAIVEAMHYGTGAYDLYRGGINHFSRERDFRGVAYRDGSGRIWLYGSVSQHEAETLRPCR
jgi:hypothetical protein